MQAGSPIGLLLALTYATGDLFNQVVGIIVDSDTNIASIGADVNNATIGADGNNLIADADTNTDLIINSDSAIIEL